MCRSIRVHGGRADP